MTASPWLTMAAAGQRINRSKRFMIREVKAGNLKAAQIGGRGEYITRDEWVDDYAEARATPVPMAPRRRFA